jgi:HEAT repeat protein
MKRLLSVVFITLLLFLLLGTGVWAIDDNYYLQLLKYGTDSDIEKAFNQVKTDLGERVNSKVLDVFKEEHAEKVYMSIAFYINFIGLKAAHDVLLKELEKMGRSEDYRETVIHTIGQLKNSSSLSTLLNLLNDTQTSTREKKALIDSVGEIGDISAEEILMGIVRNQYEEVDVRAHAILSLGKILSEKSTPLLIDILNNPYEEKIMRMYAASSLSQIGGNESLEALAKLINDESHEVAEYATSGIAQMKTKEGGKILLQALRSDYDKVRYYAAIGLGDIGFEEAVDSLKFRAAHDTNDLVRSEAKQSLEKILKNNQPQQGNEDIENLE